MSVSSRVQSIQELLTKAHLELRELNSLGVVYDLSPLATTVEQVKLAFEVLSDDLVSIRAIAPEGAK